MTPSTGLECNILWHAITSSQRVGWQEQRTTDNGQRTTDSGQRTRAGIGMWKRGSVRGADEGATLVYAKRPGKTLLALCFLTAFATATHKDREREREGAGVQQFHLWDTKPAQFRDTATDTDAKAKAKATATAATKA